MPSCRRLRAKKTGRACRGGYQPPGSLWPLRGAGRSEIDPYTAPKEAYSNAVMASSILAIMASAVAMESAAAV